MTANAIPNVSRVAPWFGADTAVAAAIGRLLGRRKSTAVPFCGGLAALAHINTRTGIATDKHRHIINLARVIAHDLLRPKLIARLEMTLFHPDELVDAQEYCRKREAGRSGGLFGTTSAASPDDGIPSIEWARNYFVAVWMGRGGKAGTKDELNQSLSLRYKASGGDSVVRFRSAIASLEEWAAFLRPWQFDVCDGFDLIWRMADDEGNGLYVDAPWPDAGDEYRYPFTDAQQCDLAKALERFEKARVVVRYGDHRLIRELYPERRWRWNLRTTRDQANGAVAEVLIVNGPAADGGA